MKSVYFCVYLSKKVTLQPLRLQGFLWYARLDSNQTPPFIVAKKLLDSI